MFCKEMKHRMNEVVGNQSTNIEKSKGEIALYVEIEQ